VITFTYQPALRPALPCVYGPLDYREQRTLFQRIDSILSASGLEEEFIMLTLAEREIDTGSATAARLERFAKYSVLALRTNIARTLTGLDHRDFATRLADSPLLQWFLRVGEMGSIKAFSKSTSDRLSRWAGEQTVRVINEKLTNLLGAIDPKNEQVDPLANTFGLAETIQFNDIYFDSTCIKADIHFPIDWVLLRDAARTLMKATTLIRKHGLKHRMPQEPLEFLSDMNTLCMKMTAKSHAADGRKHRKKVLREMKDLEKRIAAHARAHVEILKTRRVETDLSEPQAQLIIKRIDNVLDQLPAAVKQAHERIIGGRRIANEDKILSLYDDQINVIKRGKAGAQVEFGNKLWLGETREGIIVDYQFYQDNPSDTALIKPALERLVDAQQLAIGNIWGDRGLASKPNTALLEKLGIGNGLCPRNVSELADKLTNQQGFRAGLKRRAATEGRIGIFKNVFLGRRLLAKGFEHRQLAVGWAVLTHNLWVVVRMAEAEKKRKEDQEQKERIASARAA
jgi:IS5 family transposase